MKQLDELCRNRVTFERDYISDSYITELAMLVIM